MDYLAIADTVIFRGLIMEALLWFLTGWQLCTAEVWSEPELPTLSELQPSELLKLPTLSELQPSKLLKALFRSIKLK